MANKLLYEPRSPRGDHGKLVIDNRVPLSIPFYFEWNDYDEFNKPIPHIIKDTDIIKGVLKEQARYNADILTFEFKNVINNTILLEIPTKDLQILRPGIEYVLGFTLYSNEDTPELALLKELPVVVERVMVWANQL